MGDYTSAPDPSAASTNSASSSADPAIPAQSGVQADSTSQPAQSSSFPVDLSPQAESQIPADLSAEASVSADSPIQASASDIPPAAVPVSDIQVSPPIFEQQVVAPEQVFEASASADVAPQENTSIAPDSFDEISQPNPPENPSVQPSQNTPEIPVISIGQRPPETIIQPNPQPSFQPVEATEETSIHDSSSINPPIQVQPSQSVSTSRVTQSSIEKSQKESAEIKSEPIQPIQNSQTPPSDALNTTFGDLMGDKADIPELPSINIEPIEAHVMEPDNQPQPTDDSEKQAFAIRRQHAVEARKQKYTEHLNSIIELVQKKGNVNNLDVRDFLHVSQTTATDYLHTLVNSGKLKKDGKAKATTYSLL